ncbi:MAG: hypothetical protein JJT78_04760 [Leptospira sp.]|nr:hypothetical protein [Leptospira sp.]
MNTSCYLGAHATKYLVTSSFLNPLPSGATQGRESPKSPESIFKRRLQVMKRILGIQVEVAGRDRVGGIGGSIK